MALYEFVLGISFSSEHVVVIFSPDYKSIYIVQDFTLLLLLYLPHHLCDGVC
jgi:hypothetical protein